MTINPESSIPFDETRYRAAVAEVRRLFEAPTTPGEIIRTLERIGWAEMVERSAKAMWELRMSPTDPAWKDVDRGVRIEYEKDARAALLAAMPGLAKEIN